MAIEKTVTSTTENGMTVVTEITDQWTTKEIYPVEGQTWHLTVTHIHTASMNQVGIREGGHLLTPETARRIAAAYLRAAEIAEEV